MSTFLFLLLIAAMIATVVVLVRGLAAFLLNASADARGDGDPNVPTESTLKSNKMMQYRIFFQAIAIFIIVLILFIGSARN
jgi:hypothetical protein